MTTSNQSIDKVYTLTEETHFKNFHVNAIDVYLYYSKGDGYRKRRGYYLSINPTYHHDNMVEECPLDGVLIFLEGTNRFSRKRLEQLDNETSVLNYIDHYFPELKLTIDKTNTM